ncbi:MULTISPECIES: hypothetical protein [Maricaulis]|uniref:hypothetical protein n=1 Tax=Maricaulis TaxID=74317 RepID=UPI0002EFDFEE|nr:MULTISPECIES: hypothetical protein [Maricaulis]MAC88282.1 hypothetical protein [Maricaulis sp.]
MTNPPPYRLTFADAIEVWLMHWDKNHQHNIAAHFGVNSGRINDVVKERIHIGSREAALMKKSA